MFVVVLGVIIKLSFSWYYNFGLRSAYAPGRKERRFRAWGARLANSHKTPSEGLSAPQYLSGDFAKLAQYT